MSQEVQQDAKEQTIPNNTDFLRGCEFALPVLIEPTLKEFDSKTIEKEALLGANCNSPLQVFIKGSRKSLARERSFTTATSTIKAFMGLLTKYNALLLDHTNDKGETYKAMISSLKDERGYNKPLLRYIESKLENMESKKTIKPREPSPVHTSPRHSNSGVTV